MASGSRLSQSSFGDVEELMFDIDHESALLIAELQLEDALAVSASSQGKGKAREDAPLSDQEIALQLQAEELSGWKQSLQDGALARSIDNALESDTEIIEEYRMAEEIAAGDRRVAQLTHLATNFVPQPQNPPKTFGENSGWNDFLSALIRLNASRPTATGWQPDSGKQVVPNIDKLFATVLQTIASPSVDQFRSVPCVSCTDSFRICDTLRGQCGDYWCGGCLASMMKVYLRDESLHPLGCCQKAFATSELSKVVKDQGALAQFEAKRREYEVPAQDRVYCLRPTCSAYLGSANNYPSRLSMFGPRLPGVATCHSCRTVTCVACRQADHPGDTCSQNVAANQVRALAQKEGWQTCPGCSAIVTIDHGCFHMTCRCRTQFCYMCGVRWKNCTCPQWDERRLLARA